MFGISPTKNKMAIVCQSRGSPRPYLYGSRVQNMQRHARIYTGPAGRGLINKVEDKAKKNKLYVPQAPMSPSNPLIKLFYCTSSIHIEKSSLHHELSV